MMRYTMMLFSFLVSFNCLSQEQQLIAASQAGASAVFFDVAAPSVPLVQPGAFKDAGECEVRGGLPSFFAKARSGKPLRIAYLGGSITRSNLMYRLQSAKFIHGMFTAVEIKGINAGISGTDADLGACRLQEQVLQYQPDLLFIEFAVNGGFVKGVEGIIRQTKKYNKNIDICLIYTVTSRQLKEYEQGQIPLGIQKLDSIAQHYSLPSIHMAKEAASLWKAGKLIDTGDPAKVTGQLVFSQDGVHPLPPGGDLYAAAIARSLLKIQTAKPVKTESLPAPLHADNWEDARMLSPLEIAKFSEGWRKEDTDAAGFKSYKEWFPYLMVADKPGDAFSFTFRGSMFGFFDIGGPEAGQLDILVDGKSVKLTRKGTNLYKIVEGSGDQLNRFNPFCNNRYRGQFICIELPEGLHQVTFKISEEIPDKRKILGQNQLEDITLHPDKYNRSVIYLGKILIRGVYAVK
ncbi:SGNH/GDSL hydrolase family protein [Pedobacter heparinus]|uniref:SGNH/GDSL hydrolase family protein n=1 Tax=Pedobacter heparinus TaxID=984 RepID=UPI00292CCE60|nr:SGNH/GDSL hydrolase family protein [Pedobacter heparinus]